MFRGDDNSLNIYPSAALPRGTNRIDRLDNPKCPIRRPGADALAHPQREPNADNHHRIEHLQAMPEVTKESMQIMAKCSFAVANAMKGLMKL